MTEQPRSAPFVSIVMPVHQAAGQVARAIRAVCALDFDDFELLVVDDASGDATAREAHAATTDDRVRVLIREQNGGSTRARWTGIAAARGAYVWQVDVDDEWDPAILSTLVDAARHADADLAVCRARHVERNGRTQVMEGVDLATTFEGGELAELMLDGTLRGYLWNKLFRRELLECGGREPLTSQDDFLVVLRAVERAERVAMVPDVLYTYRDTPGSISDSSQLRLDNVALCHDEALERLSRGGKHSIDAELREYFTCWFLLVPVLTTPAHQGWPRSEAEEVRRKYRPLLTWRLIGHAAHRDCQLAMHATAVKVLGPAFAPAYRAVGRVAGFSIQPTR